LGRTDLVLVTGGENVDPEEVERALRELREVQDACVFGLPSAEFGLRIAAVVVLQKISWARAPALRIAALREGLARTLAPSKIPRSFVFAAALPVTATGKLDRAACVRQFGALAGEDAGARRLSVR
jgi:acyl-CoA synthetase (AMP-forming)/AMP-acid ligase II